jgi:hypothetical protein
MDNPLATRPANAVRSLVSRKLMLAAACVFAFGIGSTQFMWCGGFFNDNCYPEYVACAGGCGCEIGG